MASTINAKHAYTDRVVESYTEYSKNNSTNLGYESGYRFSNNKESNAFLAGLNDGYTGDNAWASFDRWYSVDLSQEGPSGRHYIFICRPDLNLVQQSGSSGSNSRYLNETNGVSEDPYFRYLADYYPDIISSLTAEYNITTPTNLGDAKAGSGYGNSQYNAIEGGKNLPVHALLPYLTSRAESLQLPDYTIKTDEIRQPFTRYGIPYASSAIESMTGGDFDITFRDDKYFSVRKLFYAWIYYMDGVMRDRFTPKDKYIIYNCFDYATSIYDFLVDETGENVIWWTKYTGCFPYQVPLSDLSFNRGSAPDSKCTISFKYYICEPASYATLIDFNYNSLGYRYMRDGINSDGTASFRNDAMQPNLTFADSSVAEKYRSSAGTFLGANFVGRPCIYIEKSNYDGHLGIKLKWLTKG